MSIYVCTDRLHWLENGFEQKGGGEIVSQQYDYINGVTNWNSWIMLL